MWSTLNTNNLRNKQLTPKNLEKSTKDFLNLSPELLSRSSLMSREIFPASNGGVPMCIACSVNENHIPRISISLTQPLPSTRIGNQQFSFNWRVNVQNELINVRHKKPSSKSRYATNLLTTVNFICTNIKATWPEFVIVFQLNNYLTENYVIT